MRIKEFNGVEFKVYTDTKIEGDFIHPDEAVYFENDIEITGSLEVGYLKCEKSISVHKSYKIKCWEAVGESQKVGWSQVVGGSQEVGGYQKVGGSQVVGESQKVGGSQVVGWSQEVGESQKVGGYQEVGGSQEVGGDLTAGSSKVSLQSTVGGEYRVEGKVFIGVCEWKETTKKEETLTCGKFISGDIKHGYLVEVGNRKKRVKSKLKDKRYEISLSEKADKPYIVIDDMKQGGKTVFAGTLEHIQINKLLEEENGIKEIMVSKLNKE